MGTYEATCNFDSGGGRVGKKGKPYLGKDATKLMAKGWVKDPVKEAYARADKAKKDAVEAQAVADQAVEDAKLKAKEDAKKSLADNKAAKDEEAKNKEMLN